MKKMFLIGLAVLALAGCNKSKTPEAVADDEQGQHGERRGPHRGFCEAPDADARLARMQKCQSEATTACNTKVYGSATPTKDVLCGDKAKMKEVRQCVRATYGDDREKQHADRKKMRECMGGGSGGGGGGDEE